MPGIAAVVVSCLLAVEPASVEPPEASVAPAPYKSRIERIALEGALGSLAGAVGFMGGALLGGFSSQLGLYLALVGGPIGLTVGVLGTGYWMDGNGSWLATLAGSAAGMFAAYAFMTNPSFFRFGSDPFTTYAGALIVVGIPTLAAVVFYEVTSADSRTRVEREQHALRLFPVIGPSSAGRGVVLGLGGLL